MRSTFQCDFTTEMQPSLGWSPAAAGGAHVFCSVQPKNNWGYITLWVGCWLERSWSCYVCQGKIRTFAFPENCCIFQLYYCKGEREDISLIRKAEGWWCQHRGTALQHQPVLSLLAFTSTPLPQGAHSTTLLAASLRDPECRSGSPEEPQHVLRFPWQSGVVPHPSTSPRQWLSSQSCAGLLNTQNKMSPTNCSHFCPNLPSPHALPAHFVLPQSTLKPLHILLALFQLSWHNTVSPVPNHAFSGMIPIGKSKFW